jgi:hypothetical protein
MRKQTTTRNAGALKPQARTVGSFPRFRTVPVCCPAQPALVVRVHRADDLADLLRIDGIEIHFLRPLRAT